MNRRNSGVYWIGEVPGHWDVARTSSRFEVRLGKMVDAASNSGDEVRPYLRNVNVQWDSLDLDDVAEMSFTKAECATYELRAGDLLVCEGGEVGRTAIWQDQLAGCLYQKAIHRLRATRPVVERWFFYCLSAAAGQGVFRLEGNQSTIVHLTAEKLRAHRFPFPPVSEQRAIADYLDAETTRIDALISKKRRLAAVVAERLREHREALLVARPDARWTPLHRLTDAHRPIVYGIVQAGEECPGGVPYIKSGDVAQLDSATLSRTTPEIDQQYRRARVHPGDIVMAMRASIGLSALVPPSLPTANLTQGTARIAPAVGVDGRWLYEALQTRAVQEQCQVRAVGTTFKTLNIWDLRRVEIPTPPVHIQPELAALLGQQRAETTKLIKALESQIDLLVEHRQALITAAVTGELAEEVAA